MNAGRMEQAGAGRTLVAGMERARASTARTSAAFGQAQTKSRGFFSGFRGAARVAGGLTALTVAGVALNRRFPVIGQVAAKSFAAVTQGARGAVTATSAAARSMGNLRHAATAAVGLYSLGKAFQALRGSAQASTGGGGRGGIFGSVLGGSMLGNLAADGIKTAVRTAWGQAMGALGGAADMEQVKISFGVMLGDDAAGDRLIADIQKKAASTPYEFPGLAEAAQTMLQFGVAGESIMPTLDMLGDLAGGNEQKLKSLALVFGQMSSTGRLTGQDLLQMINAGFNPLQEMAARTGKDIKTLKKEMEMGNISSDEVIQAFRDATSEGGRFYGMMARQSKTAKGLMAGLKDAWGMNLLAFGSPVLESIKPLLSDA
ncbi:MAG TPA: tape measure protein, partial [Bacteroidia bacterium]|nr:tape measure protein [Bacteroidia bacterium]